MGVVTRSNAGALNWRWKFSTIIWCQICHVIRMLYINYFPSHLYVHVNSFSPSPVIHCALMSVIKAPVPSKVQSGSSVAGDKILMVMTGAA
jgi:hypothetical protein